MFAHLDFPSPCPCVSNFELVLLYESIFNVYCELYIGSWCTNRLLTRDELWRIHLELGFATATSRTFMSDCWIKIPLLGDENEWFKNINNTNKTRKNPIISCASYAAAVKSSLRRIDIVNSVYPLSLFSYSIL